MPTRKIEKSLDKANNALTEIQKRDNQIKGMQSALQDYKERDAPTWTLNETKNDINRLERERMFAVEGLREAVLEMAREIQNV